MDLQIVKYLVRWANYQLPVTLMRSITVQPAKYEYDYILTIDAKQTKLCTVWFVKRTFSQAEVHDLNTSKYKLKYFDSHAGIAIFQAVLKRTQKGYNVQARIL